MHSRLLHPSDFAVASFALLASACLIVDEQKIEGIGELGPNSTIVVQTDRPGTEAAVYTRDNLVFLAGPEDNISLQAYDCDPSYLGLYESVPDDLGHLPLIPITIQDSSSDLPVFSLPMASAGAWLSRDDSGFVSDNGEPPILLFTGFEPMGLNLGHSPTQMVSRSAGCNTTVYVGTATARQNSTIYMTEIRDRTPMSASVDYGSSILVSAGNAEEHFVALLVERTHLDILDQHKKKLARFPRPDDVGLATSPVHQIVLFRGGFEDVLQGGDVLTKYVSHIDTMDAEGAPQRSWSYQEDGPGDGIAPRSSVTAGKDGKIFVLPTASDRLLATSDSNTVINIARPPGGGLGFCESLDFAHTVCSPKNFFSLFSKNEVVSLVLKDELEARVTIVHDIQADDPEIAECDPVDNGAYELDVLPYLDGTLVSYGPNLAFAKGGTCVNVSSPAEHFEFTLGALVGTAFGEMYRPQLATRPRF